MTHALDILRHMADGRATTAKHVKQAKGLQLRQVQNSLCHLVSQGYVSVEMPVNGSLPAIYRITAAGVERSQWKPKQYWKKKPSTFVARTMSIFSMGAGA